jgi:hypothetical protein
MLGEFERADTQVLGVSVDSIYCHGNWAKSLGGVSFPLLADFHPKGAMAKKYGVPGRKRHHRAQQTWGRPVPDPKLAPQAGSAPLASPLEKITGRNLPKPGRPRQRAL